MSIPERSLLDGITSIPSSWCKIASLGSNSNPIMIFSIIVFNVTLKFFGKPSPIVKCPCGSASISITRFPTLDSPTPRLIVVVVFATPPF